jgi:hypothetical protein
VGESVPRIVIFQGPGRIVDVPQPPQPPEPARPADAADPVQAQAPTTGRIIINGKDVTMEGGGPDVITSTGFPLPPDIPTNVYKLAETGIVSFALMIAAFPIFGFAKALVNRRANAQAALPPREMTDRLARIEAAVDAMSVEVERISEGQRFVTRVLSERSSAGS